MRIGCSIILLHNSESNSINVQLCWNISSSVTVLFQTCNSIAIRMQAVHFNTSSLHGFYSTMVSLTLHTCVIFSRLALGFNGASVKRTGCSSGATRSSL